MEIILVISYTLLFILIIYKLPFFEILGFSRKPLVIVFLIKILCGIILYYIYSYYYSDRQTADIFKYFDDSKVMYDALFTNPLDYIKMLTGIKNDAPHFYEYYSKMNYWFRIYESNIYNDSHTIIRFNALIRLFSFGYFNVHTVFICFLSLTGLVGLYKFFIKYLSDRKYEVFFAVFLMPSVLFWGSGVLKEGILLFGMGLLVYFSDKFIRRQNIIISLIIMVFSAILLAYTKFYIIICLIPIIIAYCWVCITSDKYILLKYLTVIILYICFGLIIPHIFPGYDFLEIMSLKQHDFINLAVSVNSGSYIYVPDLEPNIWSFITNAPIAFINTMFRPFITEANSIFMIFAASENILIIIMILICCFSFSRKIYQKNLFYFSLFAVIAIFTITGLITPVMGALVRYKIPGLPFLIIILIILSDKEKVHNIFNKFLFFKKM